MPTDPSSLTLAVILTAGGATAAAAFVTGLVEITKRLLPIVVSRDWEFRLAAIFAVVLVVAAMASQMQAGALTLSLETGFAGILAWYGITTMAGAIFDQVSDLTKPQTP